MSESLRKSKKAVITAAEPFPRPAEKPDNRQTNPDNRRRESCRRAQDTSSTSTGSDVRLPHSSRKATLPGRNATGSYAFTCLRPLASGSER